MEENLNKIKNKRRDGFTELTKTQSVNLTPVAKTVTRDISKRQVNVSSVVKIFNFKYLYVYLQFLSKGVH